MGSRTGDAVAGRATDAAGRATDAAGRGGLGTVRNAVRLLELLGEGPAY